MVRCDFCFEQYEADVALGVCPHCGYYHGMAQSDPRFLPIGCCINSRYIVGGVVGNGGFGITYRAWDMTLQVVVAIKEYYQRGVVNRIPGTKDVFIVAPDRQEEFDYGKGRLLREARIVSQFQSHPIVRVNDFFEENGTSYMVMEYIDCATLADTMIEKRQPFAPDVAVAIGLQICEALEEIHAAGVLHRDVAPDNIFITENGDVKIIDFGSARLDQEDTMEQLILVKEGFSPIEQYEVLNPKQKLQQAWTDIYALGATLYYLVTGVRPEESRSRKTHVENHESDMPEPRELNPQVSENLNNTIMRALAINSHERFSSAQQMSSALQGKTTVQPLAATRRKKKIRRAVSIAAAFVVAVAIALVAILNGATRYDDITLDAADISIWFPCTGSSGFEAVYDEGNESWNFTEGNAETDEKATALLAVIGEEAKSAQFDNVLVSVRGIPVAQYTDTLNTAQQGNAMPSLFVCLDKKAQYMENTTDVSRISRSLGSGTRNCRFVDDYTDLFKQGKAIPTGFIVPVIYFNSAYVPDHPSGTRLDSAAGLWELADGTLGYMPMEIDAERLKLHEASLSDLKDYYGSIEKAEHEAFLNEEAAVLMADSACYPAVQEALVGLFSLSIPGKTPTCCFSDYWAISNHTEAERTASEVMLAFFFTDNAQNTLYLRKGAAALPVNRTALGRYATVYTELGIVEEYADDFAFIEVIPEWK